MKIATKSSDPSHLDGWTPSLETLKKAQDGFDIAAKDEMRPCGCGIKLDLQDVVYPALGAAARELTQTKVSGVGLRTDFFSHPGRLDAVERLILPDEQLPSVTDKVAEVVARHRADALVELYSSSLSYYTQREQLREHFKRMVLMKAGIWTAAQRRKQEAQGNLSPLRFGKGHSIGAGGDFSMIDLLRFRPGTGHTAVNNDTIATADSMLRHGCAISVFTAFNNSLNDLFLAGITDELRLFPAYDGAPGEIDSIRQATEAYAELYAARGVSLKVDDRGPLGRGVKVIGATVSGHAAHELPGLPNLIPGQRIMATRFLGDLSVLALHRGLHFPETEHPELDELRWKVLQQFCTPNYVAAKILQEFLPGAGRSFRPDRHVTFASDVSGPGFFVLEEGAEASGVSVLVRDFRFLSEAGLRNYRRNQLSSTNGPILFSAYPDVAYEVAQRLLEAGYAQVWEVGEVVERREKRVLLSRRLREKHNDDDPRTDLFAPEVHFGEGPNITRERMPIFESYAFVDE